MTKQKVLFIQPNKLVPKSLEEDKFTRPIPSLPAMTILGTLKDYETHFIDATADGLGKSFDFNGDRLALGLNERELEERIAEIKPDYALITAMFTSEYLVANRTADMIRKRFRIPVVMGGHQVTLMPHWHIDHADVLVLGEGEENINSVLKGLEKKDLSNIPGIAYKDNQSTLRMTQRRPLDDLDRDWRIGEVILNEQGQQRYPISTTIRNKEVYPIKSPETSGTGVLYSSRGCPYACGYCNATRRDGKEVRHMSLQNTIRITQEFLDLGINVFQNESDTFGMHPLDRKYLEWIAKQKKHEENIEMVNTNSFFARYFFPKGEFDPGRVDLLKEAGFRTLTLSIESSLKRFNRGKLEGITPEMLEDCLSYIKGKGMNTDVYMMYLFPEQTEQELKEDIRLIERLKPHITATTWRSLTYFPGTEYYDWMIGTNKFREEGYKLMIDFYGHSFYKPDQRFNFSHIRNIPVLP